MKTIYKCGCEASGDNVSTYCPMHGDKIKENNMMTGIETIKMTVEVQANGIIRNEKGRLIARLVDDVKFEGEHVKGLNYKRESLCLCCYKNKATICPGCSDHWGESEKCPDNK